jgi:hypothetical protein
MYDYTVSVIRVAHGASSISLVNIVNRCGASATAIYGGILYQDSIYSRIQSQYSPDRAADIPADRERAIARGHDRRTALPAPVIGDRKPGHSYWPMGRPPFMMSRATLQLVLLGAGSGSTKRHKGPHRNPRAETWLPFAGWRSRRLQTCASSGVPDRDAKSRGIAYDPRDFGVGVMASLSLSALASALNSRGDLRPVA